MTSLQLQQRIDTLQAQRAAQWLEILKAGRREDIAAFAAWCRESPVHIREFLEATWVHQEVTALKKDGQTDADALLREIAADVRLFPQSLPTPSRPKVYRNRRLFALAAGLALIVASLLIFVPLRDPDQQFTTKVGEQRTVELADTSVVQLNTDSEIQVNFAQNERNVELRHGEAIFKVAHDRTRPFRVHTRIAVVTAVGTQFNVYDRPEGIDVAVLEGRIRVMPRGSTVSQDFIAAEQARIDADGTIHRIAHPDMQRVTAWSKRRLKFERATLDEIVREFNRYNRTQIRIEGSAVGSRSYRGIFDADDPQSLADLLERENDLVVERGASEILIRKK